MLLLRWSRSLTVRASCTLISVAAPGRSPPPGFRGERSPAGLARAPSPARCGALGPAALCVRTGGAAFGAGAAPGGARGAESPFALPRRSEVTLKRLHTSSSPPIQVLSCWGRSKIAAGRGAAGGLTAARSPGAAICGRAGGGDRGAATNPRGHRAAPRSRPALPPRC